MRRDGTALDEAAAAELAVVIPTLNQRENVPILVERLAAALKGIRWEAIFVDDDSEDGTADVVREIAQRRANIRILQRLGRRGRSSASIEGILASAAPYVAIIEAGPQYDAALLPQMLARMKRQRVDIVVASRPAAGGRANRLAKLLTKAELGDPSSGFFLIERGAFSAAMRHLSGQGFRLLLDLFASAPRPLSFVELPVAARERQAETPIVWECMVLLLDKMVGHIVPVRFLLFATIGGIGVFTHLAILWLATHPLGLAFAFGQAAATLGAMTGNFFLNNLLTYRDRRLRGWHLWRGLLSFYAVCGLGALANVGIAAHLFGDNHSWWLAGLAGAAISSVWNYTMSAVFTWRAGVGVPAGSGGAGRRVRQNRRVGAPEGSLS